MTNEKLSSIVKVVLIPLVGAVVAAWAEHRTAGVKDRQDAAYAVTAPALRDLQTEQVKVAAQVELLTKLITAHVLEHPAATPRVETPHAARPRPSLGSGLGSLGGGSGSGARPVDQQKIAEHLRDATRMNAPMQQRSIPDSPDEALMMQRAGKK